MVPPIAIQGLEFVGLDLPDSIGELLVCRVLVLAKECQRYFHALCKPECIRVGIMELAQGDGWLLTVALIEGSNLAAVDSSGFCDRYVVFTCNGKLEPAQ